MTRSTLAYAALTFVGLITGIVGVGAHRFHPYWGSILVILMVLASATFARATRAWLGLSVYAASWYLVVFYLFAIRGPGNSVVILDDALGRTLFIGGAAAIIAVAFLPSAWMREPGDGPREAPVTERSAATRGDMMEPHSNARPEEPS
jgi:hypothetical protein